jgi:hypothetical protein
MSVEAICANVSGFASVAMCLTALLVCMQCSSGQFSASGASACTACSAGKTLVDPAGDTDAESCGYVSVFDACSS